tara:strand:- start:487 stop:1260 length:774 start_codon:yes stop_codon:yes gene_type:complete
MNLIHTVFYKDQWRWSSFLRHLIFKLQEFNCINNAVPAKYAYRESTYGSKRSKTNVQLYTASLNNSRIDLARAVCINSPNYSVLNFLIIPKSVYNFPFFGVDFVSLPNMHLLVLDFQPSLSVEKQFDKKLLEHIISLKNICHQYVPYAERMPATLQRFFSPGLIWSKLPLGIKSDQLISNQIYSSFTEYLALYLENLFNQEKVDKKLQDKITEGQEFYLEYRKKNDPARPMLIKLFGKEFTEELINNLLFSKKKFYN